jgi:hypothetical protein
MLMMKVSRKSSFSPGRLTLSPQFRESHLKGRIFPGFLAPLDIRYSDRTFDFQQQNGVCCD